MINFNLNTQILNMIIADDGKGFDASAPLVNNGLKNMNERANKHQWQLTVRSGQNAGTTIMLNAPIA